MNESTLTDNERLELEVLCSAMADGNITSVERERLEKCIVQNKAAAEFYVRYMGLSASLREYAGETQSEGNVIPFPQDHSSKRWWWAVAAVAAVAVALIAIFPRPSGASLEVALIEDDAADGIAIFSAGENCTWKQASFQPGNSFKAGQTIELLGGIAEIAFDCGARIVLQGPTTLQLTSAWEASLTKGTLRATVPQEAIGFRVSNPEVDIVDLGTEFSVVTDELGESEVFVHEGAIEVHAKQKKPNDAKPRKSVMREKESRRFAKTGTSEVRDVEKKWQVLAKKAPAQTELKPSVIKRWNWSATDMNGIQPVGGSALVFADGQRGSALRFSGNHGARVTVPNWSKDQARTISLWVRIPTDSPLADAPPFLSWRTQSKVQGVLEAALNDDPAHGVVGALSVRLGNRKIVGSKPLRDGAWHHIAIVVIRQQKEGSAPDLHSRLFVDGRLEARSGKASSKKVRNKNAPPIEPGLLLASGVDDSPGEFFVGDIEGLLIADGVLSQNEIRQSMAVGVPN